jgi:tripartite-type tricarboxylate transporter receptor subunit TctC
MRAFVNGLGLLPVVLLAASEAAAQTYPTRPVRLVVGFAAGGGSDLLSRKLAERLQPRLGQPVVVENRPGAGAAIAAQAVAQAEPDGYTLYAAGGSVTVLRIFNKQLTLDVQKDLAPIAKYADTVAAIVSDARLPVKTLPELIAHARANPGKLNYGTASGSGQLALENLKRLAGVDMVHIQYKGASEYTTALLAGQIQMIIDSPASHIGNVEAGKVRLLAISTRTRAAGFPSVPPVADTLPAWEYGNWNAVLAPARTPRALIDRLSREIVAIASSEEFRNDLQSWSKGAYFAAPASADELGAQIARDMRMWEEIARAAKIE